MAAVSAGQQYCTGMLISVHYIALYICWQVCRGAMKIMLWLWKFCDNFGLRKQHLGCHDGCGLMAVDIDCRILGTALCWNGRSDWLLHRFDVSCTGTGNRERSLAPHTGGKWQSESDPRSSAHCIVTVTLRSTEHFRVTMTNIVRSRQSYHFVFWSLVSCVLLNSPSECCPQCARRTLVCCRLRRGVQNCRQ